MLRTGDNVKWLAGVEREVGEGMQVCRFQGKGGVSSRRWSDHALTLLGTPTSWSALRLLTGRTRGRWGAGEHGGVLPMHCPKAEQTLGVPGRSNA
ncbi:hypothetical protein [Desulfoplanes sp.]